MRSASQALLHIARAIATLDVQAVVNRAARLTADTLRADRAVVYLVSKGHLEMVAATGSRTRRGRWPLDTIGPYTQRILAKQSVLHVPRIEKPNKEYDLWFLSFVGAPIRVGKDLLGCLQVGTTRSLRTFRRDEIRLVLGIADQVAVAVRNARLAEENRQRLRQLEDLSRRVWRAEEDERARISRELHDEAGQALVALKMKLATLRDRHNAGAVDEIAALASEVIENLRRISRDLRPNSLDELGLTAAVRSLASSVRSSRRCEVSVDLPAFPLDAEHESIAFRFVQEALTNVSRHAKARNVHVVGSRSRGRVRIEVRDDGIGFDPKKRSSGLGLAGMRERAGVAGGSVSVRSKPGSGTVLVLTLPALRAVGAS